MSAMHCHRRHALKLLGATPLIAGLTGCVTMESHATRVAVSGGLILCGIWPQVADDVLATLGLPVQTMVATAQESIAATFAKGEADVLLTQAGDETAALEGQGLAEAGRVWGWNEYVLVGPSSDPAGVRGAENAEQAMQRIAQQASPFLLLRDPGSHAVVQRLWNKAGILPNQSWIRTDTSPLAHTALEQAARQGAYAVVGHIPWRFGRMDTPGIELLFKGDALMRRPYLVLTPGPRHTASPAHRQTAKKLADYLLSAQGQAALVQANVTTGDTWVFGRDSVPVV